MFTVRCYVVCRTLWTRSDTLFLLLQEVQQCIEEQRASMKEVLEDARLVSLQREGGAVLARMRREDFRFPQSEDYRYHIIFKCLSLLLAPISMVYTERHTSQQQCSEF